MATVTATSLSGSGSRAVTVTTLTASDTFTYVPGSILVLNNGTAGALTPNIDGDGATTVPVRGVGSVDVSTGYDVPSIGAGATVAIPLDSIAQYLKGTIALTGGSGIEAQLLTP